MATYCLLLVLVIVELAAMRGKSPYVILVVIHLLLCLDDCRGVYVRRL